MNATNRNTVRSFAYPRRRRLQAIIRPRRRPVTTPRVVLHFLVGAITLVTAQALLVPLTRTREDAVGGPVVYAEQQRPPAPSVSAPALSITAPTQPSQQV